jgi:hypothetical protein
MLSLSHKFLFVHIPKTGGNSIQKILQPHSEDRIVALTAQDGMERFEVRGRFTQHKHATLADYHSRVPPELFAELFKFCAVRNPWSRAVSFYFTPRRWMKRGTSPFWSRDDFLELLAQLPPMVDYLKIDGQIQTLGGIIEYEHLSEQLRSVLDRVGLEIDGGQLPHLNRSLAGDYRAYFEADRDLVDLVAERYREDIAYFGYRFEG